MRRALRFGFLSLFALAGCASATDAKRHGEPVANATIDAIHDDPAAWDGKWVRLSGWIDAHATLIAASKEEGDVDRALSLDPRHKLRRPDSQSGELVKEAVISGRVDLECVRAWNEGYAAMAREGIVDDFKIAPGPTDYCNRASGPNLVNVIVSTPARMQK